MIITKKTTTMGGVSHKVMHLHQGGIERSHEIQDQTTADAATIEFEMHMQSVPKRNRGVWRGTVQGTTDPDL